MVSRVIVHVDLDAFFASVEEVLQPALRGLPIVVGGPAGGRGVVASASYAARAQGVRSAMPVAEAVRRCPDAIVLPLRHDIYRQYSRRVMEVLDTVTPVIEQVSIDEAFLDLSGVPWETGIAEARRAQAALRARIGLTASVGAATNKLVAKIASDERKPAGLTAIPPGDEASFLAPLPIERLWGVGPRTAAALRSLGLQTVGQVAAAPSATLQRLLGTVGRALQLRARGLDDSPIVLNRPVRSISAEHTFSRDTVDRAEVQRRLRLLVDDIAMGLRRADLVGRTVVLKLRYRTFETVTRSTTLLVPTDREGQLVHTASSLLRETWHGQTPLRLVGVGVQHLSSAGLVQPSLFCDADPPDSRVTHAIERIRSRYGRDAIQRGAGMGNQRPGNLT